MVLVNYVGHSVLVRDWTNAEMLGGSLAWELLKGNRSEVAAALCIL
jgi:hypothetical protein